MMTQAAVVQTRHRHPFEAGALLGRELLTRLHGCRPHVVLVFATTGYDQQQLLGGLSELLGEVPGVGCSGEGIIAEHDTDEGSHAAAVLGIVAERARFATLVVEGLRDDAEAAGRQLAEKVAQLTVAHGPGRALLLFPDGLTLNFTRFFQGLQRGGLPEDLLVAGAGAGDMMRWEHTWQYCDGRAFRDSVAALWIGGELEIDQVVSHGCDPIGIERVVTRAEGRSVYEIDHRPAWTAFCEYLEGQPERMNAEDVVYLSVGEPIEGPASYGRHIIRVPVAHDPDSGALDFAVEMVPGTRITMTRRVPHRVVESAVTAAADLQRRHPGQRPRFVLQLDCAGRGRSLFGTRCTELGLHPLQRQLGADLPWLGFYTFGEIAALEGRTHFHNYTVVLLAAYDPAEDV